MISPNVNILYKSFPKKVAKKCHRSSAVDGRTTPCTSLEDEAGAGKKEEKLRNTPISICVMDGWIYHCL
jgi:hypothetical protein